LGYYPVLQIVDLPVSNLLNNPGMDDRDNRSASDRAADNAILTFTTFITGAPSRGRLALMW
jgi:hypothetical protein